MSEVACSHGQANCCRLRNTVAQDDGRSNICRHSLYHRHPVHHLGRAGCRKTVLHDGAVHFSQHPLRLQVFLQPMLERIEEAQENDQAKDDDRRRNGGSHEYRNVIVLNYPNCIPL